MPCYSPLQGYFKIQPNGKKKFVGSNVAFLSWTKNLFKDSLRVAIPCGQCRGCRLERSRQWAMRCVHEASLHLDNCFITLTYSPEHLPDDYSLNKKHFQDFLKRFRAAIIPKELRKRGMGEIRKAWVKAHPIRYFHCGEYGERYMRPHYHAIIFNYDFKDRDLVGTTKAGFPIYSSKFLSKLWPFGISSVGACNFETAAYVARYVMKKINGSIADEHYTRVHPDSGKVFRVLPEYTTMSRRPGIARVWYEKFKTDIFPSDECVFRGKVMKPPRFYDNILSSDDPITFELIKERRSLLAEKNSFDNTYARLKVREAKNKIDSSKLIRGLESQI